jgi:hypothetical protein
MNDANDVGEAPDVDLSIDQLILPGLPGVNRTLVERTFRHELGRLLAAEPPRRSTHGTVDLGRPLDLRLPANASSRQIGHQLAQVIYGAVRR